MKTTIRLLSLVFFTSCIALVLTVPAGAQDALAPTPNTPVADAVSSFITGFAASHRDGGQ